MSTNWPVLFPDETVLMETRTPFRITLLVALAGLAAGLLLLPLALPFAAPAPDPKAVFLMGVVTPLAFILLTMPISVARLLVTTHRVAVRRGFGGRFSLLFPEITGLEQTTFGLHLQSERRPRPVRLWLIADAGRVARTIRERTRI